MRLFFDSANTNFLELYENNITFLEDYFVIEGELEVKEFLDDYGVSINDLKSVGIKAFKNGITIPKGTEAIVLQEKPNETTIEIKDISFECNMNNGYYGAEVEVEPINKELNILDKYKKLAPREDCEDILYGYNLYDIVCAVNWYYKLDDIARATEEIKLMLPRQVKDAVNLYTSHVEALQREKELDKG